jgi:hypothetical protein
MPNEIPQDALSKTWLDQPVENIAMPLEEIRRRAGKFERRVRWRNAREYTATAIVVAVFGYYIQAVPSAVARAGSVLTIAGALYVTWQLHRRGSSGTSPAAGAFEDCLVFHRLELERQRAALASVWRWYLGPLVPGLAVFIAGTTLAMPIPIGYRMVTAAIMLAIIGVVFWLVAKLNRSGARKLQAQIDELQALGR